MKRWEIYWAEVPFEEKDGSKIRPVVILNDRTAFVISFGIYSASPRPFTNDFPIRDWKQTGLDHESTIRVDRRIKIEKQQIHDKIGELSKRDSMILALYNDL